MDDIAKKWNDLSQDDQAAAIAKFSIGYSIDAMKKLMADQAWDLREAKDVVGYAMGQQREEKSQSK